MAPSLPEGSLNLNIHIAAKAEEADTMVVEVSPQNVSLKSNFFAPGVKLESIVQRLWKHRYAQKAQSVNLDSLSLYEKVPPKAMPATSATHQRKLGRRKAKLPQKFACIEVKKKKVRPSSTQGKKMDSKNSPYKGQQRFANSFMLFSRVHRPIAAQLMGKATNREVSTELSNWWNAFEPKLKQQYTALSKSLARLGKGTDTQQLLDRTLEGMPRFDPSTYDPESIQLNLSKEDIAKLYYKGKTPSKKHELVINFLTKKLNPTKEDIKDLMAEHSDLFPTPHSMKTFIRATRQRLQHLRLNLH